MSKEIILAHPWFGPLLAAVTAIPLALLGSRVAGAVLRRLARGTPVAHTMLVNVQPAARVALPLIALQMVWQAAPDTLRFVDSMRHL